MQLGLKKKNENSVICGTKKIKKHRVVCGMKVNVRMTLGNRQDVLVGDLVYFCPN